MTGKFHSKYKYNDVRVTKKITVKPKLATEILTIENSELMEYYRREPFHKVDTTQY